MKAPIFLFSMPRAGSTLMQRLLLANASIGGTAEPWLLLPFIYALKKHGIVSEYSHKICQEAINEFITLLPNGEQAYNDELRKFISGLYRAQLHDEEIYFLDKTPRYYLIIPEIARVFPDAKFIFLFRHPLQILASLK